MMRPRLPDNLLPIARDGSGGLVRLSVHGPDKGHVYYWDYYQEGLPKSSSNIYPGRPTLF